MAKETDQESKGYAVVRIDGRPQRVSQGDRIRFQSLVGDQKKADQDTLPKEIVFSDVLIASKGDGKAATIGAPLVKGASVKAKILGQGRGEKLVVFKRKRRQGFLKKKGCRAPFIEAEVTAITCP